ncbi:MAG: hypothetical protein LUC18_00060 [Porphyromonadaceae bacterium]|nr:hypothetical protein [Porphyromonadaceae bacterium]
MKTYIESRTYKLTKTELPNGHALYRLVNRETGEVERDYGESLFHSWTAVSVHAGNYFFANPNNIAKKARTPFSCLYRLYRDRAANPASTPEIRRYYEEKFEWLAELAILEN